MSDPTPPAAAREALGASIQIRAGAPWCGSGAIEPRDLGFSRAAGVGAMGRRKMSAAAPPSRSWSNVGGSVIPGKIPWLGLMRVVALRHCQMLRIGAGLLVFLFMEIGLCGCGVKM